LGYEHDVYYDNRQAQEHLREAEYYSKRNSYDSVNTYQQRAKNAADKAENYARKARKARERAQDYMRKAEYALKKAK